MTRDNRGRFTRAEITAPILTRKAATKRGLAVAQGNRTRASIRRRAALAMFNVVLS